MSLPKIDYSLLKAQIDKAMIELGIDTSIQVETPEGLELEITSNLPSQSYEEIQAEAEAMKQKAIEMASAPEYQNAIEQMKQDYFLDFEKPLTFDNLPTLSPEEKEQLDLAVARYQERITQKEYEIESGERKPGKLLRYFDYSKDVIKSKEQYEQFLEKSSELGLTQLTFEGKFHDLTSGMDFSLGGILGGVVEQWTDLFKETGKNIKNVASDVWTGITDVFKFLTKDLWKWLIIILIVIIAILIVYFVIKTYLRAKIEKKVYKR